MSDIVERCRKNQCKENMGCNTNPNCSCADLEDAADTIEQLRAELAALRPDADRYNWLTRNSGVGLTSRQQVVLYLPTDLILQPVEGLTAAIDQAMLAAKEPPNA